MFDLNNTGPTPDDLGVRTEFNKVLVPFTRLMEEAEKAGLSLHGRRFVDCVIHGPCVIVPGGDTRFENSSLGDAHGDVRNLFLRAVGPMLTGCIPVNGCVFDGCAFVGVGFAGDDRFIEHFVTMLNGGAG